jgi:hypothetical protein
MYGQYRVRAAEHEDKGILSLDERAVGCQSWRRIRFAFSGLLGTRRFQRLRRLRQSRCRVERAKGVDQDRQTSDERERTHASVYFG